MPLKAGSQGAARDIGRRPVATPAIPIRGAPHADAELGQTVELSEAAELAGVISRTRATTIAGLRAEPRAHQATVFHGHQALLALQRTVGNAAVQRLIQAKPLVIQRQPSSSLSGIHTITDPKAVIRDGPPKFKSTGKTLAVGRRVEIIATEKTAKGTFVNLVEPGTTKTLGWTSQANLGAVQYAQAAASFVYIAKVQPRGGAAETLPVMVYLPPNFKGKQKTDIVLYLHGDAADYSASKSNNYSRENPAIGMHLAGAATGANRIVIAPQVNEWRAGRMKSPWHTLHAGDYESIVQTALTNLQGDLKLPAAIPRGVISIAGHSGGGKGLGQAAKDLDPTGGGVKDVTLVEAGYGGREDKQGKGAGSFAKSFQMVRDWLLEGNPEKVLRVITKAGSSGTDTRHAIENNPDPKKDAGGIPVLGLAGVRNAIKAKGRDAELQADATELKTDPQQRTGGMQLIRKIVVSRKSGGKIQGTIYVFLMTEPPRPQGEDKHFGVRNATIGALVSGQGKGDDFATP